MDQLWVPWLGALSHQGDLTNALFAQCMPAVTSTEQGRGEGTVWLRQGRWYRVRGCVAEWQQTQCFVAIPQLPQRGRAM
jgi:hypothetical protein